MSEGNFLDLVTEPMSNDEGEECEENNHEGGEEQMWPMIVTLTIV